MNPLVPGHGRMLLLATFLTLAFVYGWSHFETKIVTENTPQTSQPTLKETLAIVPRDEATEGTTVQNPLLVREELVEGTITETVAPSKLANFTITGTAGLSSSEINQRFVGLLSHVHWLLQGRQSTNTIHTITDNSLADQVNRLERQIFRTMDNNQEDISDLADEIANLPIPSDSDLSGTTTAYSLLATNLITTARLGVGTTSPSGIFAVVGDTVLDGDLSLSGVFRDSANSAGVDGYVLQSTGTGVEWVATSTLGFALGGGAGTGTVSSVNASGGTTGLTFTGGPITNAGVLTLSGTLAVANGGTGITSFGSGIADFLGLPSSANLASALTDETGTGNLVFSTSPTLTGNINLPGGIWNSNGNVGIGTTTSSLQATGLTIQNTITSSVISLFDTAHRSFLKLYGLPSTSQTLAFSMLSDASSYIMQNVSVNGGTAGNILINPYGGNVGIGTTTPGTSLVVQGTSATGILLPQRTDLTSVSGILNFQTAGWNLWGIRQSSGALTFGQQPSLGGAFTEYARFDSSGNFGLGTSTPGAKLHVTSGVSGQSPTSINGIFVENGGGSNTGFVFQTATAVGKSFSITNAGNVGIGTTTPSATLTLQNTSGNIFQTYGSSGNTVTISTNGSIQHTLLNTSRYMISANGNTDFNIPGGWDGGAIRLGANSDQSIISGGGGAAPGLLAFFTGNSTTSPQMIITNTGNVGIGTTTPIEKLSVNSGNIGLTNGFSLLWGTALGNKPFISGSDTTQVLRLGTNSIDRMTIDPNGQVGIGTTTPTELFEVNGNIQIGNNQFLRGRSSAGTAYNLIGINSSGNTEVGTLNSLIFRTNGSERVRIDGSGNFGIGTTTPSFNLDVNGGKVRSYASATDASFVFAKGTGKAGILAAGDMGSGFNFDETGKFAIGRSTRSAIDSGVYGGVDILTVLASGNVGIGTTTPGAKLEVSGSARFAAENSSWTFDDETNRRLGFVKQSGLNTHLTSATGSPIIFSRSNNIDVGTVGQTLTESMRISSNGNVGIGITNPLRNLHISGVGNPELLIEATAFASGSFGRIWGIGNDANGNLFFRAANSTISGSNTALTMTAGGNIGIGTSTPGSTLTVAGTSSLRNVIPEGPYTFNISPYSLGASTARFANVWTEFVNLGTSTWSIAGRGSLQDRFAIFDGPSGTGSERFTITNAGNIGIGTVSPQSGFILDVNGQSVMRGNVLLDGSVVEFNTSAYRLDGVGGNSFINRNAGNFGIGTSTPNRKLEINDNSGPQIRLSRSAFNYIDLYANTSAEGLAISNNVGSVANLLSNMFGGVAVTGLDLLVSKDLGFRAPIDKGVGLYVNGNTTPTLYATSTGLVGIGTTNPGATLSIEGTTNSLFLNRTGSEPNIGFNSNSVGVAQIRGIATGGLRFTNGASSLEWMRFDANGNIGIGTSTPTAPLYVNGGAFFPLVVDRDSGSGAGGIQFSSSGTGLGRVAGIVGGGMAFTNGNGGTEWARFTPLGYFGIGTTTPGSRFVVAVAGGYTSLDGSTLTTTGSGSVRYELSPNGGISYGLTNIIPVDGGALRLGIAQGSSYITGAQQGTAGFNVFVGATSSPKMTITSAGNVGIGTSTPGFLLHVAGQSRFEDRINALPTGSATNPSYTFFSATNVGMYLANGGLRFATNGSDAMSVASSSNVGIGTTNPTTKLDIVDTAPINTVVQIAKSQALVSGSNGTTLSINNYPNYPAGSTNTGLQGITNYYQIHTNSTSTSGYNKVLYNQAKTTAGTGMLNTLALNENGFEYGGGSMNFGTVVGVSSASAVYGGNGNIDNIKYMYVNPVITGGYTGTISNQYGLYMDNMTGATNNYSIYSLGGTMYHAGNVGIGTTTPSDLLSLYKLSGTSRLRVDSASTTGYFGNDGSEAIVQVASNKSIKFQTGTSFIERMRIDANGNVGIGTTTPSSLLTVAGNTYIGGNLTATGITSLLNASTTNLTVANNAYFGGNTGIWSGSGNVGIGTLAPAALLDISSTTPGSEALVATFRNNGSSANTAVTIDLNPSLAGLGGRSAQLTAINNGGNQISLAFRTSNADIPAEAMRINHLGRVGIGTTTPGSLLTVAGNTYIGGNLIATGNVGIGTTTPSNKLSISGTSNGDGINFDSSGTIIGTIARNIVTGSTVGLSIDGVSGRSVSIGGQVNTNVLLSAAGGNVGIGTTTPGSKLTVATVGGLIANFETTSVAGGYLSFTNNGSVGGFIGIGSSLTSGAGLADISLRTNGGNILFSNSGGIELARITNFGNVGIGTTNPVNMLSVATSTAVAVTAFSELNEATAYLRQTGVAGNGNYGALLGFGDISGTAHLGAGIAIKQTSSDDDQTGLSFLVHSNTNTNSSLFEAMVINHSGNVGLGTSSPTAKLDVYQTGTASTEYGIIARAVGAASLNAAGYFEAINGTANRGVIINVATGTSNYNLYAGGTAQNYFAGNVGIGDTTPVAALDVTGSASFGSVISPNRRVDIDSSGRTTFHYADNNLQNMVTLNNSGVTTAGHGTSILFQHSSTTANPLNAARISAITEGAYTTQANSNSSLSFHTGTNGNLGEAMRILSSGNIGIGVTTPFSKLSFGTASAGEGTANMIRVYDDSDVITSTTSNSYGIGMRATDGRLAFTAGVSGYHAFYTANTQRMVIRADGNVGIGVPVPSYKLDVAGTFNVSGTTTTGRLHVAGATNPGNFGVVGNGTQATTLATSRSLAATSIQTLNTSGWLLTTFMAGDNPSMQVVDQAGTSAGNFNLMPYGGSVGIGTSANNVYDAVAAARPLVVQRSDTSTLLGGSQASLAIVNGDTTTNNTAQLNFAAITGTSTNQYSGAIISAIFGARTNAQYPSGQLAFLTSTATNLTPTEKMRIDNNGNVGIGTTTPSQKLTVAGDINMTGDLYKNGVLVGGGGSQWTTAGSDIHYNTGNVGIGSSTPVARLSVTGTGLSTGIGFQVANASNTPRFTVFNSGSVGIGTSTGLTKTLSVDGDVQIGAAASSQWLDFTFQGITKRSTNGFNDITINGHGGVGVVQLNSTGGNVTINNTAGAAPTKTLSFGGNADRTLGVERKSISGAGASLTINAGATNDSNSDGGSLNFSSGVGKGLGSSFISFATSPVGGAGSSDNAVQTRMYIRNNGNVEVSNLVSCGGIQTNGSGAMSCTSDERLKNIQGEFTAGLDAIMEIDPQTYTWKQDSGLYDGDIDYSGFIAQNVEAAISEAVTTNPQGTKQVNTTTILAAAVNAIKELNQNLLTASSSLARVLTVVDTNSASTTNSALVINEVGNLGIGTSTPSERLTVAGTIQATSLLGGSTNLSTDANGNIIRDPSDQRLKENITTIENAMDTLLGLRGVRYEWVDKERFGEQYEIGFIAQEVNEVVPEVVQKGGEYWSLNTKNLLAVVVEAMKEMWEKVQAHDERLVELESENDALKARLEAVEAELGVEVEEPEVDEEEPVESEPELDVPEGGNGEEEIPADDLGGDEEAEEGETEVLPATQGDEGEVSADGVGEGG